MTTLALFLALSTISIFTIKDHVDNPGQTAMKDSATRSGPTAQDHVENPSNTPLK